MRPFAVLPAARRVPALAVALTVALICLACVVADPGAPPADSAGQPAGGADGRSVPLRIADLGAGSTLVYVPVTIAGQGPFQFVLDTGASKTAIDPQLARRLELAVVHGAAGVAQTAGGQSADPVQVLRVDEWRIGEVALPSTTVVTLELAWPDDDTAPDGLLGSDVLRHFGAVTIDYGAATLRLPAGG
jgi:hypothetical protein